MTRARTVDSKHTLLDPPAVAGRRMTIDEFERLPDTPWQLELVDGLVVCEPPPGYRHGLITGRIVALLGPFVTERDLGHVLTCDPGFVLSEERETLRAPDVAFVSKERVPDDEAQERAARMAPDLAIEVLSPSNSVSQMHAKVLDFLRAGTRCVWIVDPRERTVAVHDSPAHVRLLHETDDLDGGDVLPGFSVRVSELF